MQGVQKITVESSAERPALEAIRAVTEGLPAVVAPPHPLYGGSIDVPVVQAVFRALQSRGYAPFAFNWRGIGNSGGRASGELVHAIEDYAAVADLAVADTSGAGFVAAGYSWGAAAAVCMAVGRNDVERLVLVAPPVAMAEALPWGAVTQPIHVVVGSDDSFAPHESLRRTLADRQGSRLDVVDGADHFFSNGVEAVERHIAQA